MKKRILFSVIMLTGLCIAGLSQAQGWFFEEKKEFEDKPALSTAEWVALWCAKGTGGALGAGAGLVTTSATMELAETGLAGVIGEPEQLLDPIHEDVQWGKTKVIKRAQLPMAAGGYAGYKGGKWAAIRALAKRHGVSPRIEVVSQFYNINAPQYRALLRAAEHKDQEALPISINDLYTQRFGKDWQERLQQLFKKYRRKGKKLVEEGSFALEGDEKNFVRMVELGAAMENLYSGSDPNKGAAVGLAKDLYTDLGLL